MNNFVIYILIVLYRHGEQYYRAEEDAGHRARVEQYYRAEELRYSAPAFERFQDVKIVIKTHFFSVSKMLAAELATLYNLIIYFFL